MTPENCSSVWIIEAKGVVDEVFHKRVLQISMNPNLTIVHIV